ncbi:hypothetical protein PhCBS80983_g05647 [Powellomyces hirtus]|uniref:GST C-terminal domain-containing protein n=1 Tax=Powellomyces hirtus TaxID=109895 RepID=A0A507DTG9_9FUNG|nr:hypothetical protein PhCBS80983_g05647 [Powellomyces hirtus]
MAADDRVKGGAALELFMWGPAYNLPSFDPFCLSAAAYLQLAEVTWVVNECNNAGVSPRGELPMLRDSLLEPVVTTSKIIAHLKKKGYDLDQHLSATEAAECLAFTGLVEDKLHDALLFSWWLEAKNVMKSTRPTISKSLRGWAGFRVPSQLQKKAEARLKRYRTVTYKGKETNEIYVLVREWYKALANKLGEQPYFFGSRPSSLDAVVFGHLALHCIPSLAEPTLFSILTFEFPTLYAYCERMREDLFGAPLRASANHGASWILGDIVRSPMVYMRTVFSPAAGKKEKSVEERRAEVGTWMSVVGAVGFFVGYIFYSGIVRIEIGDGDGDGNVDVDVDGEEGGGWQDADAHNDHNTE